MNRPRHPRNGRKLGCPIHMNGIYRRENYIQMCTVVNEGAKAKRSKKNY